MASSSGTPKPRVLPVPVLAWPMMSCRDRATGSVIAWMGNGWVMPASASAWTISGRTSKSANDASTACTDEYVFLSGRVMGAARAEAASSGAFVLVSVVTVDSSLRGW